MTLPSPLVPKKIQTYLVWRHSDVISDVMSKTRKSPKIAKIMVFRYFFKQKLHFLAMMCVKVCLHMFLLQINQINKIKHSESVSWNKKTTKNTICVTRNQFDMYSFVSQSWCAFWQKNDMLLKWSILKSTSEPKPQRKAYHLKDTALLCDF